MALPTCECVKGLPIGEQLAAIYCATYTLAAGDVDGPYLLKAANLSDVADPVASRGNIGAAASGANTDITSLDPVGSNWSISSAGNILVQANAAAGFFFDFLTNGYSWDATEGAYFTSSASFIVQIDNNNNQSNETFSIYTDSGTPRGGTLLFDVSVTAATLGVGLALIVDKTITGGGTTGAQTINKIAGSVNFAAAAASLVVTNSKVTTSSVIQLTVAANDVTMKSAHYVPGSGSFTIYPDTAPTAETRVDFFVIN